MTPVDPTDATTNLGSGGASYTPPSLSGGSSRSKADRSADDEDGARRQATGAGPPQGADRYLPGDELGRGGWGYVQSAEDRQLDRAVAVKRINGELAHASSIHDRFFYEARVTGQLQHPGIVPVHELGVDEEGAPFYVMKLLEGSTFKETIREAHRRPEALAGGFSVDLLDRFAAICNAVAYAHQQGIVHRDLKPSNVMVGRFGETIVVDWGLAKQIEEPAGSGACGGATSESSTDSDASRGAVLGTPAYMSPEQSEGESDRVGPATDIYALGVILYEVLTGANPFRSDSVETTLSRVREGDCRPPRAINRRVPHALAAICTTAMAKRPEDRYETAEQIVEDLQRFLAGDPVSVYREPWWEKALRWCRRRPALTAGVLGSVAVLTIASLIFGAVIHRAHQAEQAARLAALDRLAESREASDAWLIGLSGSLQFFPGMNGLRAQLLEDATEHYTTLAKRLAETRTLGDAARLERARCELRLGDLHRLQEHREKALDHYQQALAILDAPDPSWAMRAELANARIGLALLGEPVDLTADREWLAAQRSDGRLDDDAANQVANTTARLALAEVRRDSSGAVDSIEALRQAQASAMSLVARRGEPRDHQLLQAVRDELVPRLRQAGVPNEARGVWLAEVDRLEKLAGDRPDRPDLLQSLAYARMELAGLDGEAERSGEAAAGYRSAIDDLRKAWRLSDADSYYRRNVAASHVGLSRLEADGLLARDHLNEAIQQLRQAVAIEGPSAGDLARLAECYKGLGAIAEHRGEPDALANYQRAEQCYAVLADHGQLSSELAEKREANLSAIKRLTQADPAKPSAEAD